MEELARRFAGRRRYWFVGGGPNTATAYEAALKMSEANHSTALGFNCEQFLHGPWAALDAEDVVFLIAPPGPSHERCLAVARVAKDVGAALVALAREDDRDLAALATETIALPPVNELLSPILEKTYGVIVTQDQVLQIAREFAGFTYAEADILRKAVGKKIKKLLVEQSEKLIKGMVSHGIEKKTAEKDGDGSRGPKAAGTCATP